MKRVVITGASSGIGAQTARLCARRGHRLVLAARSVARLQDLAKECSAEGSPKTLVCAVDFNEPTTARSLENALYQLGDGEPVLVSNAGTFNPGQFAESDFETHAGQVTVNLLGAMAAAHALIPAMLAHGSGQIVQVASIAATQSFPGAAAYCASKAGLLSFGRSISLEYRNQGIRVTSILPGATATPIWKGESHPPFEKMLTAESVAEAIVTVIDLPPDRTIDELTITPPLGIL